jgi:membrane protein required for colicin V production
MTLFDYAVLAIIGLSVLISVLRGGVSEILSLTAWVLAFFLAQRFAEPVSVWLPPEVPTPELRLIAGFAIVFFGVWFVSALVRIAIAQMIKASALALVDRLVGAVFGFARGCIIVIAFVILGGLTRFPTLPIWRDAMFSPPFEAVALKLKPWLPAGLAERLRYE